MLRRPLLVASLLALVTRVVPGHAIAPAPASPAAASGASAAAEFDSMIERLDAEEQALKAEIDRIGPEIEITRRRMIARGRAYYRHIRAGLLPVGGGFDALVDHAARVERTRRALERDLATGTVLVQRRIEINERLTHLRAERAPLDLQREAMQRARAALQAEQERRAAFARAFETSVRPDHLAIYGADVGPADADTRTGFAVLKGRLPFPIAGRAEVRRVMRANAPGIELAAAAGSPVRSVATGRVVFADHYADYGRTVIIDHGDRYYSVYANLASTSLAVGDKVPSGGRVGVVGSEVAGAPMLYFEIRHGAENIDPAPWLGL
jgi:murein DD-endopeptidase MepM/ murein hydrolase activator NlpD